MEELIAAFLEQHVRYLRGMRREYDGVIKLYFGPIRHYTIPELRPFIIEKWFHGIGNHSKSQANKCLSILRTMLERGKCWEMYTGDNMAKRVKPYRMDSRTRFVMPNEAPLLMATLAREDEMTQCFFLLPLYTASRRDEGLGMRWSDLDVPSCIWNSVHTKTGRPRPVPIPAHFMLKLSALPRRCEYVFSTKRLTRWSRALARLKWCAIREQAGIPDVTIHDLRRSCASWLAMNGHNLAVIRDTLGHTSFAHTGIYTRLMLGTMRKALEANSQMMLGNPPTGTQKPVPPQSIAEAGPA